MCELRVLLRAAVLAALCAIAAACARPVGDFGRAQDSVLHDEVMPTIGKARAALSGEPVSRFNLTDQEREMHDRVWRFLVAPHAHGWFQDIVVELQRTRIAGAADHSFRPDRYFRWLHRTDYRSSRTRYRTIADDADSDLDTLPTTFRSICAVIEVDRQRGVASREMRGLAIDDVEARRAENDAFIGWFTRALRYRYESYGYALDRLLVETPHEEAVEADAVLIELAIHVERAERGDFCAAGSVGHRGHVRKVPSRVLLPVPDEGAYLK